MINNNFFSKIKDLSSIGIANILSNAIGGIFWFYIATLIEVDQYGEINYIIAMASVAGAISSLGTSTTVTVFSAKKENVLPAISILALICSIVAALVIFILIEDIGASIYIVTFVIFGILIADVLGRKMYKDYALYTVIQRSLMFVISIILYYLIGYEGIILGVAISFLPFTFKLYQTIKSQKIDFNIIKINKNFILNNYVLELSRTFVGSLDKIIIVPLFGFMILGNYQLGIQFLWLLALIPNTVFQYILPRDSTNMLNIKLKILTIFVSIIIAILGIFFAPIILSSLFPKFTDASEIVKIVSIAIIPISINLMYISKFLGILQSKIVLGGSGIFIISQILGIIILGNLFGIIGIAWAIVLANSMESCYLIIMGKYYKHSEESINQ